MTARQPFGTLILAREEPIAAIRQGGGDGLDPFVAANQLRVKSAMATVLDHFRARRTGAWVACAPRARMAASFRPRFAAA